MKSTSKNQICKGDRFIKTAIPQKSILVEGKEKESHYKQIVLMSCKENHELQEGVFENSLLHRINRMCEGISQQKTQNIQRYVADPFLTKIRPAPEKILDAPDIVDDFYLNILDWGANNYLAIGLSSSLYVWNAFNGSIEQIQRDHFQSESQGLISAVHWHNKEQLAVGFESGMIKLIDMNKQQEIKSLNYHSQRVNTVSSLGDILSSAGRDFQIINHDPRQKNQNIINVFERHTQEVCGLEWNKSTQCLASGANDNMVYIWDKRTLKLRQQLRGHCAAVKAMAWCPWQPNILVTGGGSNDRTIRYWNSDTGIALLHYLKGDCNKIIEATSQVCSIKFLEENKEFVSSHGFSNYEIALWKVETLSTQPTRIQELRGHQSRVLHLGVSPDQSMLCSAAGDETLRFWRVGCEKKSSSKNEITDTKNICLR